MLPPRALPAAEVQARLDDWLQVEFTHFALHEEAVQIAALSAEDQEFVLGWVQRSAAVNVQLGHLFATQAPRRLTPATRRPVEAWVLQALDQFDRHGLKAAVQTLRHPDRFVAPGREHAGAAVFADFSGVLQHFVAGLSGRPLRLDQTIDDAGAYTDSETIYLPTVVSRFDSAADNFQLAKVWVTLLWAKTRFGSLTCDAVGACERFPDPAHAWQCFAALETMRLEALIARDLPGIGREMSRLRRLTGTDRLEPAWQNWRERLAVPGAQARDTLACLDTAYATKPPPPPPFHCVWRPEAVAAVMAARTAREKALLRAKLAQMLERLRPPATRKADPSRITLNSATDAPNELPRHELLVDGIAVPLPDDVAPLLTSIQLDFGGIPPEYLEAAGPGDYAPAVSAPAERDPDSVWSGVYHEDGATLYPEWDYRRQSFRKNWCVMREINLPPLHDGFRERVLQRYPGLSRELRRSFEALRDCNRVERRQVEGDELDIDALVEAHCDLQAGRDVSDRLFTQRHRAERDIAVLFLVDMSGSTKGWINDVERETLLLLSEALETLGDRYAIYGFSGMTRKKCELFRIKRFDEDYGADVQGRISAIRPRDYTRMGFAVRHATHLLGQVDARRRLLIVISDGKPDDYSDRYRGPYGIEDTRRALQQAVQAGVRPFCITVDKEARDYLPQLYGSAHFTVVDDVARLPYKVGEVYRRLTH
jgi:nitric oxide reductase NorD protein